MPNKTTIITKLLVTFMKMKNVKTLIKPLTVILLFMLAPYNQALATGAGLTINDIYYCGSDFSMAMSNGERWVVQNNTVGAQKFNHFLSIAMYMMASGKGNGVGPR